MILDLSFLVGQSINDGVAKDKYLDSYFQLKHLSVDDVVYKFKQLGTNALLYKIVHLGTSE